MLKLIGVILIAIAMIFMLPLVIGFVLSIFLLVLVAFLFAYIFDLEITIKGNNEKIGTYRRSTGFRKL